MHDFQGSRTRGVSFRVDDVCSTARESIRKVGVRVETADTDGCLFVAEKAFRIGS